MPSALRIPGDRDPNWSTLPDACLCSAARLLSRFVSRPLERCLAGQGFTITEFQVMVLLRDHPARAFELSRRLRLDPAPVSRALTRLAEHGMVRRACPGRFTEWILERSGDLHLEVLEIGWVAVNDEVHRQLGDLPPLPVRVVDRLQYPLPRKHQGWSDD